MKYDAKASARHKQISTVEKKTPWKDWDPLVIAINIEVQRYNSQMILEREPIPVDLIQPDLIKCQISVAKQRELAIKELQKEIVGRCRPSDKHTEEVSFEGSMEPNMSDWENTNQSPAMYFFVPKFWVTQ